MTCARSATRASIEKKTIENFFQKGKLFQEKALFTIFDNASTFTSHWNPRDSGMNYTLYVSRRNLGLWSAIKYMVDSLDRDYGGTIKYLYIIESDLIHDSFDLLPTLTRTLDIREDLGMFRTQVFSRHKRWQYDKKFSFLPASLHRAESAVTWRNAVSHDRATFEKIDGSTLLLSTNLHAKLPGLHRIEVLQEVLQSLADRNPFTERDFFEQYMKKFSTHGILNGGIWEATTSIRANPEETASYAQEGRYESLGYLRTRTASIMSYDERDIEKTLHTDFSSL